MTVEFAIRDDDTCFYTNPSTLRRIYADIWNCVPITLACVPNISPQADVLYSIPSDATENRSIAENHELVSSLRNWQMDGMVEIAVHGYDHANYDGSPEFVTGPNLATRISNGRELLENTFECDVDVFVPPHGQLSSRGVRAVQQAKMNIGREYGPKPREFQFHPRWPLVYSRMVAFYLKYGHQYRYPTILNYGTHREVYCHRLSDETNVNWLMDAFDYIDNHDGVFSLSTHAPELSSTGKKTLHQIIEYAEGRARFSTLGQILNQR